MSGVPQEKNNEVSGLTALARNIGGSLGISFISTMLVRRAQVHQELSRRARLCRCGQYRNLQQSISRAMEAGGISSANVANSAAGQIYNTMLQQARTLAYVDTIQVLVVIIGCLIPIGYLMKKPRFRAKRVEVAE